MKLLARTVMLLALAGLSLPALARESAGSAKLEAGVRLYESMVRRAGLEPGELENYSMGQSHIDAAWRWRKHQTREKCRITFTNAVRHMEQFPDFHYSQSAPQYYEWVMEDEPHDWDDPRFPQVEGEWADARKAICSACPKLTKFKFCSVCNCFMPLKARLASSSCPEKKW